MFEAVEGLVSEHADLEQRLADPAIHADQARAKKLNQRYAELSAIIRAYREWQLLGDDSEAAQELASEDPAFAEEAESFAEKRTVAEERLRHLLVPRDPSDGKDALLEIKSGEGGEESALFAGDLLRMYTRYAERRGWKTEQLDADRVRPRWFQVGDRRGEGEGVARAGRGALRAAEVRGRRPSCAARAGDRVAGPRAHLGRRGARDAGGRAGRRDHQRERPAHRRVPVVGARGAVGQHHRLRGPDHSPAHRHRRLLPEREVAAAEQGAGDADPARSAAAGRPGRGQHRGVRRAQVAGAHGRPVRAHPHLQLPGEPHLRPPHRLQGLQPRPGARRRPGAGRRKSCVDADLAARLEQLGG